jgi:hypothetical protein
MLDNQLIQLFVPIISAGLIAQGYTGVKVKASYQPTQQGTENVPVVYFYKVFDRLYGFLHRYDYWDSNASQEVHTETQVYETTFQIMAYAQQDPANINSVTASDYANIVASILQSDSSRETMQASDVQILRVTDVRNLSMINDQDQFQYVPSFDFVLTHEQSVVTTSPVVESFTPGIYGI